MKLKAVRSHYCGGVVVAVGTVYEAADRLGRELIATGKATAAPADPPKVKPAKTVMTVASSPELVAGGMATEAKESQHAT